MAVRGYAPAVQFGRIWPVRVGIDPKMCWCPRFDPGVVDAPNTSVDFIRLGTERSSMGNALETETWNYFGAATWTLGILKNLKYFLAFELYYIIYVTALPFVLFSNRTVIWKGREY
jgi:hypothetical protein